MFVNIDGLIDVHRLLNILRHFNLPDHLSWNLLDHLLYHFIRNLPLHLNVLRHLHNLIYNPLGAWDVLWDLHLHFDYFLDGDLLDYLDWFLDHFVNVEWGFGFLKVEFLGEACQVESEFVFVGFEITKLLFCLSVSAF